MRCQRSFQEIRKTFSRRVGVFLVVSTEESPSERARRLVTAVLIINRLTATFGYNLAYFLVGVAIAFPTVPAASLDVVAWFGIGVMLAKMQASVADAIHDRAVDSINPAKSSIAWSVDIIGQNRAWSLLVAEIVSAMFAFSVVAVRTDDQLFFLLGAAFTLLGFVYSYPPRLKERGVVNHVVTTGVDVCFVVLPVPYLLIGTFTTRTLVIGAVVALYSFAYHVVHQAADVYYDRQQGIASYARSLGAPQSLALAAVLTATAGAVAVASGYYLAALVLLAVTVHYASLCRRVRGRPLRRQSEIVSSGFNIAWVATALNVATGVSVLLGSGI